MKVFACRNINEDVRVNSSSGGIFSVICGKYFGRERNHIME